jgi:hypothetical protein
MPAKRDEEDKHSEESLELISKAMFSSSFIDYVVNYIVEEVK